VSRIWGWIVGFGRFWYDFIIGDDWTVAAAIAARLVLTTQFKARHVPAWWLMPVIVVIMVGVSLRRASRPHH
jgi:hypothetical protein